MIDGEPELVELGVLDIDVDLYMTVAGVLLDGLIA